MKSLTNQRESKVTDTGNTSTAKSEGVKLPESIQVQPTVQATAALLAQTLNMRMALLLTWMTATGTALGYFASNTTVGFSGIAIYSNIKALCAALLAYYVTLMTRSLLRRNFLWIQYYSERLKKLEEYVGKKVLFPMFSGQGDITSPVHNDNDPNFERNVKKSVEFIIIVWITLILGQSLILIFQICRSV